MGRSRAVICGLARDVADVLPHTIASLERIGNMFADYRVVLYENDSTDDTLAQLRNWQRTNGRVEILSEKLGKPRWPTIFSFERTRDLAYYRNQYRDFVVRKFSDYDFAIVTETDLLGWSYDGLANSFGHEGWDVVGSQGISHWKGRQVHYDWWAFRALDQPEDWDDDTAFRSMVFPRGSPMLPVASCFAGLAVYKMAALRAGTYDGSDCEHATLHRQIRNAGFSGVFFNPSMVMLYPDFETLQPSCKKLPWWERYQA